MDKMKVGGRFKVECWNEDGSLAWVEEFDNGVNNSALNDILNVYFNSGTVKTTWYIGLIDNAGFSALSQTDTMSSHAGWAESTAYSQSNRQAWGQGSASGQQITNASAATFTASGSVTLNGAFLSSDNTKGGTSGTLFATGSFASPRSYTATQSITVTYTLSAASS